MNVEIALVVCGALAMDAAFGEPRRFHPLVGFARLVQALERCIYRDSIPRGVIALLLLLVPLVAVAAAAEYLPFFWLGLLLDVALLYLAIGWRSLRLHADRVSAPLLEGDLLSARRNAGMMVSRNTEHLDREGLAGATIESVLENGNDAVFGAIFWFLLAGLPGVLLYRLSNTLDAMWGYRNARYLCFGRAAARLDDLLNWVPARLTALSYALVGKTGSALRSWKRQGSRWKSPNAGPVMAAGAGSLGLVLGGSAVYEGIRENRPLLGEGRQAQAEDIGAALRLLNRALLLWVCVLLAGAGLVDYVFY